MNLIPNNILNFWFSERVKLLWFNSTPEFDAEIRTQYLAVYYAALNDKIDEWEQSAEGCVALVIILDQFPLNMFRGLAESFHGEAKAIEIAKYAIDQSFDDLLTDKQKAFLYLPLMHSENLVDQDLSVTLFEKAGLTENLRFAKHHREIVRRFGRFPHRNRILNRQSTEAELEYLASDEAFHG